MPTARKKNILIGIFATLLVCAIAIAALVVVKTSGDNPDSSEARSYAQSVISAINKREYANLEEILGSSVARDTLLGDLEGKTVSLGQLHIYNKNSFMFSVVSEGKPPGPYIYATRDNNGKWQGNVP
ncbi:MAG: hypothetical protein SPK50_03915 [Mobiluncus porci]|uniref:hypothetical protein n=1 Tax=Mobiluncus TaxID=2050 RepID=UPI0023F4333B|nr:MULTISPECIES: hypothetical protein [Mobiluncus]MCI6584301.1 hypothetical protein [Mobiluncus sp.]MDD7540699.1 hypothetical protein [Mobiluncus porci]MDY5748262.1 hypothetical protein [Mobiluncus porci]